MKRLIAILTTCAMLGACSSAKMTSANQNVLTFLGLVQQDVAAVNQDLAQISAALAQNCGALQTAGQALVALQSVAKSAGPALSAANAVIVTFCQAPPTDIPSAISAVAAQVSAAKAAYKAAKAGN